MSTLWTPDGERPIPRGDPAPATQPEATTPLTEAEMQAEMAELRDQLAATPAEAVVANHAFGLFELAALHLSLQPPQLDQARIAIDALAALADGMAGRLGDAEAQLQDGLAQLRMAFVQISRTYAEPGEASD